MANIDYVGNGKVYLLAGGGKTYTDIAARFCQSERSVEEIIGSPQDLKILSNIVNSNHKAAMEFDDFIFGIEGYSRVTEIQLVRKRHASYMIKSGRIELNGRRSFDVTIPDSIKDIVGGIIIDPSDIKITDYMIYPDGDIMTLKEYLEKLGDTNTHSLLWYYDTTKIIKMIEDWYNIGLMEEVAEEDLRYMKPQATQFKACIKMNAAGLRDWFQIRLCNLAQMEIRDLATKMFQLCLKAAPELFEGAGRSCEVLGYCPEGNRQCLMKSTIPNKEEALKYLKTWKNEA